MARLNCLQETIRRSVAMWLPLTACVSSVKKLTIPEPLIPIINGISLVNAITKPLVPRYANSPGNINSSTATAFLNSQKSIFTDVRNGFECVNSFEKSYHTFAIILTASMPSGLTKAFSHMLLARSRIACAVCCWISYSLVTAVPSRYASLDSFK